MTNKTVTMTRTVAVVDRNALATDATYLDSVYSCEDRVMYHYYTVDTYNGTMYYAVAETFDDMWAGAGD